MSKVFENFQTEQEKQLEALDVEREYSSLVETLATQDERDDFTRHQIISHRNHEALRNMERFMEREGL